MADTTSFPYPWEVEDAWFEPRSGSLEPLLAIPSLSLAAFDGAPTRLGLLGTDEADAGLDGWTEEPGVSGEMLPGEGGTGRRHDVSTSHETQSKLIALPSAPVATPWNFPDASMVTPAKLNQPVEESHAKPERLPWPSLCTPPLAGERLIHPSLALHTYPLSALSVTVTMLFEGEKFTHPPTLLHAYLCAESMLPVAASASGAPASRTKSAVPCARVRAESTL